MRSAAFTIAPACSAADLSDAAALFHAYAAALGTDLSFQGFEAEVAGLPGRYAPPAGALLLARDAGGVPLGCVALRPLVEGGLCEMKRLYVAPPGRGRGLGRALVEAVVAAAARIGYRGLRLDTMPGMDAAIALYAGTGFAPVPPYYDTPVPGTIFLGRPLDGEDGCAGRRSALHPAPDVTETPMDLRARLTEETKASMRAGDAPRTSALRMIAAKLKDADIAARPSGVAAIPDEAITGLLRGMVKSRRESVEMYRQGNRPELAAKEEAEITVIESFLPRQMDDAAMEAAVREAVAETGATSVKEMGKVMAALKARHAAVLDMAKAGPMVKAALGG